MSVLSMSSSRMLNGIVRFEGIDECREHRPGAWIGAADPIVGQACDLPSSALTGLPERPDLHDWGIAMRWQGRSRRRLH